MPSPLWPFSMAASADDQSPFERIGPRNVDMNSAANYQFTADRSGWFMSRAHALVLAS